MSKLSQLNENTLRRCLNIDDVFKDQHELKSECIKEIKMRKKEEELIMETRISNIKKKFHFKYDELRQNYLLQCEQLKQQLSCDINKEIYSFEVKLHNFISSISQSSSNKYTQDQESSQSQVNKTLIQRSQKTNSNRYHNHSFDSDHLVSYSDQAFEDKEYQLMLDQQNQDTANKENRRLQKNAQQSGLKNNSRRSIIEETKGQKMSMNNTFMDISKDEDLQSNNQSTQKQSASQKYEGKREGKHQRPGSFSFSMQNKNDSTSHTLELTKSIFKPFQIRNEKSSSCRPKEELLNLSCSNYQHVKTSDILFSSSSESDSEDYLKTDRLKRLRCDNIKLMQNQYKSISLNSTYK